MAVENGTEGFDDLRRPPSDTKPSTATRAPANYNPQHVFDLVDTRGYKQQFADMYFLRLTLLKTSVVDICREAWTSFKIAGESAQHKDRVLDVRQGELCWIVGTIYMEMPLKPNILTDVAKENWSVIPPISHTYRSANEEDQTMLEDESGRLRLTGAVLNSETIVTGCIVGVLGSETKDGTFEVLEVKIPDLPAQPARGHKHDVKKTTLSKEGAAGKVALVSGLSMDGESGDTMAVTLLTEFLLGEAGGSQDRDYAAGITRLLVVGNSIALEDDSAAVRPSSSDNTTKKSKKYGYDASAYNPSPMAQLDAFLSHLLPSIPITILPGPTDPANVAVPQQPLHNALFPQSRYYTVPAPKPGVKPSEPSWFDSVTNPWQGDVGGLRLLVSAGQNVDDILRYVLPTELPDLSANGGPSRTLQLAEKTLRWRVLAPTAPDTLWSYPFQENDPFVLTECPHVYVVGNQGKFETMLAHGDEEQVVRIVTLPKFRETGQIVILDLETLEVELVEITV